MIFVTANSIRAPTGREWNSRLRRVGVSMTLELLLAEFDGLIQTPADVEKLNATILQWAVQGRLVPQCADDEPVEDLLEKIEIEKSELIKARRISKPKKVPRIKASEIPYDLPKEWRWVRLPEIYYSRGQKKPDKTFTYIDVSSIDNQLGVIGDELQVIAPQNAPSRARKKVANGTVIYSTVRPYLLNIAIVDRDFEPEPIVSTAFAVMHPFSGVYNKYLYYYLRSQPFVDFVESQMSGMAYPAISDSKLNMGLFPLPPLAEQKRIVARVDELLGQTAVLTQQLATVHEQRRGVHTAVLHQLTTKTSEVSSERSSPTSEVSTLATHFDRFYVDADTVAELKQAILQLAVQGRLVPQDERDEDAAVLLERIQEEKKLLISQTEGREEDTFIRLRNGEFTHPLPNNWKWTKVGEVCLYIVPNRDKPKSFTGDIPWITLPDFDEELYLYGSKDGLGLTKEEVNKYRARTVPAGSVIMSCIGRFGITGILKQDSVINQQLHAFLVPKSVDARFLVYALRTQTSYMESQATSTTILYLNKSKCNSVPFPLPPYQEQKRIVAKVDELFALCDQLAGQLTTTAATRTQLLEAVLAQA